MTLNTHILAKIKRISGYAHQDPARDWFTLLTLATITLVCIVAWNVWAFDTVASGGVIGGQASISSKDEFQQETLDTIHKVFQMRSEEEAKYRTGEYKFFDPSQ